MRVPLAKILLVIMTLSGVIMPIHVYAHKMADTYDGYVIEMDSNHVTDTDAAAKSCDHCCHFSSHYLGLMWISSNIVDLKIQNVVIFQKQNYASYKQSPPYQPPIA